MGNVMIQSCTSNISMEHSSRIYWLGRYAERAFMTMKSLERLYDKVIDRDPLHYQKYLACFGLGDSYGDSQEFFYSFIFDRENTCSVAYSLCRAYDNGIVLREEISTDTLAYLQLVLDKLDEMSVQKQGVVLSMMPLEDIIYSFYGAFMDHVYSTEIRYIFHCARALERVEMFIRLKYRNERILAEFERLCGFLQRIPDNSPYRYNSENLRKLSEIIYGENGSKGKEPQALALLSHLF